MLVMTEQYLRKQIVKSTGYLEDVFTDTDTGRHNRAFYHI